MRAALLALCALLGGCAGDIRDFNREPHLTAVGSGLHGVEAATRAAFPATPRMRGASLFEEGQSDLFRDPRASRVGDVLTVNISINDKATLGNSSDRSQDAKVRSGFDWSFGLGGFSKKSEGTIGTTSESSAKGQGNIDRSEKIQMSVAAVVTEVLGNGNLVISGSQEVRVNFELRLLQLVGVVRPRDIARDNTIAYDKIAEARISYGGRGRITEVQQPGWGHQLVDRLKPF